MENVIIVTRHAALVQHLISLGLAKEGAHVISHATPEEVAGKNVIGVLPLRLASLAETITEIPLIVPAELRGKELSLSEIKQYAGTPRTYKVHEVSNA